MKIVVTAGPTREAVDPVRYISNRSSGKMGIAVANALASMGHEVVLILGPSGIRPACGMRVVDVVTAGEMFEAVKREFDSSDALVMAAAVSDWTPRQTCDHKLKKGAASLTIECVPTRDILAEVSKYKGSRTVVGFAAETGDPVPEGRRKLESKGLDALFANDVSEKNSGFEVDTNRLVCILPGSEDHWPLMTKEEAGCRIAKIVETLHHAKQDH